MRERERIYLDLKLLTRASVRSFDCQEEDNAVFLSTLTRSQVAAVERRVTSLQQTLLRRRNRHCVPDVRDIFRPPEKVRGRTHTHTHTLTQTQTSGIVSTSKGI